MSTPSENPFQTGVKSKVIAAFLLGSLAIGLALGITYYSFNGLLSTVDELTRPNERLVILNRLYQRITQLDQLQRAEAIKNPRKSYAATLRESKPLIFTLDTLRAMEWQNEEQLLRLDEMETILRKRDKLLLSYLRMKSEFVMSAEFSERLDSLAKIISWSQANADTSVTTTEHRTVTTTYLPGPAREDNRTLLNRLFGKKKSNEPEETRIEIQEELRVKIDTLATAQQDSAISEIGRIMKNIEQKQRLQSQQMLKRELDLVNTNKNLINQLLNSLYEVEEEEKAIQQANNEQAGLLAARSIQRIQVILVVFFLGASTLVFLILTDITKSNTLRRQLIKAKEEAERSGQVKQRFLANMSHEIRTPLQSIIGFAEQLRHKPGMNAEDIDAIYSSSEHLLHIVNEVLDFSKIESGKLLLEREIFDFYGLIREVASSIRVQAEQKGLDFILETDNPSITRLIGDPFRLRQILYNVLGNAVKFTDTGAVKLSVQTADQDYMLNCRFCITDTGIGMTPEDVHHAFQQFEQARSSANRHYGGTGLGLTIVKSLIDVQHGRLAIDSAPGKGSTVNIELNFDKAPFPKPHDDTPHEQPPGAFAGKVMVVDDDPMILRLCGTILSRYEVPHILFAESEKALASPPGDDVTLILLDIRMPHISGVDLCAELRKKAHSHTRIVALTAHVLPTERTSLLDQGFDHVLTKPFREAELLDQLGLSPAANNSGDVAPPSPAPADLPILREMTMGDEALFNSILAQFVSETHDDLLKLGEAMTRPERSVIRELIHRLAGRTGQVGVEALAVLFRTLETDLDDGKDPAALADRIGHASAQLKALLKQLEGEVLKC